MTGEWVFENLVKPLLIFGVMYLCLPARFVGRARLRKYSVERLMRLRHPAATLDRYLARWDNCVVSVWARRAVPVFLVAVFVYRDPLYALYIMSYVILGILLSFLYFWLFVHLRGGVRLQRLSFLSGEVLRRIRRERGWWDPPTVFKKPIPRPLGACYWYGPVYGMVGCCAVALSGVSWPWAAVVVAVFSVPMFVERPAKLNRWIQESSELAIRLIDESVAMGRAVRPRSDRVPGRKRDKFTEQESG